MYRNFFLLTILAALCALTGCTDGNRNEPEGQAKYIFLFIGDGMGQAQVAATESYLAYQNGELGGIGKLSFTKFPYLGMATTFSANKNITCSSAAGTALATGSKTNNSMLGETPDGKELESFTYRLKDKGYRIGIISNVPVNHATPASFYANAKSRKDYYEISLQVPESGFDYFAGDGFLDFNGKDGKKEDIDRIIEGKGYTISYGMEEYNAEKGAEKLILCQKDNRKSDSENYVVKHTEEEEISLKEMVETAIDRFSADGKPFFIMAEGGTIDWAGHNNRTMPMTEKVLELDEAVKEAYAFYLKHPDETLIVVTADHETGGLTLGCGKGENIKWDMLENAWKAAGKKDIIGDEENAKLNKSANIGWSTGGHTGIPVPVYAVGHGAEMFSGCYDNTDIPKKIMRGE